jgi:hypothetical protein
MKHRLRRRPLRQRLNHFFLSVVFRQDRRTR